ncbi:RNA polymerase sigma factor [Pedobacter sp.]|uniref:RNA polymerase sigma factor n=1 Tax=Pedobacter sp. TaxID=1411316 RepID=UPI003BAAA7D2
MKAYDKISDGELFLLIKEDDEKAYAEIFKRYAEILLRHAFRLLANKEEANDVIQDVFMTLWQKRAEIEIKTALSSYLYSAIRNRIFDHLSHQKIAVRYAESISAFMIEGYNITDDVVRERELAHLIQREIDALPSRMREVFLLNKKEGLSYSQIADQMGITSETAKQQVYKAVKILKPRIDDFLSAFPFL